MCQLSVEDPQFHPPLVGPHLVEITYKEKLEKSQFFRHFENPQNQSLLRKGNANDGKITKLIENVNL